MPSRVDGPMYETAPNIYPLPYLLTVRQCSNTKSAHWCQQSKQGQRKSQIATALKRFFWKTLFLHEVIRRILFVPTIGRVIHLNGRLDVLVNKQSCSTFRNLNIFSITTGSVSTTIFYCHILISDMCVNVSIGLVGDT